MRECKNAKIEDGPYRQRRAESKQAERVLGAAPTPQMRKSRMDPMDSGVPNRSKRSAS